VQPPPPPQPTGPSTFSQANFEQEFLQRYPDLAQLSNEHSDYATFIRDEIVRPSYDAWVAEGRQLQTVTVASGPMAGERRIYPERYLESGMEHLSSLRRSFEARRAQGAQFAAFSNALDPSRERSRESRGLESLPREILEIGGRARTMGR
jgi:hypothetical protein